MSETPLRVYSPSSSVGSDNEEVFIDFGINRTEIDELKRQEII
jgi:crotonobetainyl-CoA:carnitine CoA-transferase CaiB-like acyl-CoA transferase